MAKGYCYANVRIDVDEVLDEIDTADLAAELDARSREGFVGLGDVGEELVDAVLSGDIAKAQSLARICKNKKFFEVQRQKYAAAKKVPAKQEPTEGVKP